MEKFIRHLKIWVRSFSLFGSSGLLLIIKMLYFNKSANETKSFKLKGIDNKVYLRKGTTDFMCFNDIFLNKSYEIDIPDPKWIIDCGANIGIGSVYFKVKYPESNIVSLEMEEGNFEILEKNTQNYNNIHLEKVAVWSSSDEDLILEDGNKEWGYTVTNEKKGVVFKKVKSITIDDIMKKYNIEVIDLIKIDIEGAEKEIFKEGVCEWLSKTKVLIIELHDRINPGSSIEFFKSLIKYDFNMDISGENLILFLKNKNSIT